jgi:hypothetical protein
MAAVDVEFEKGQRLHYVSALLAGSCVNEAKITFKHRVNMGLYAEQINVATVTLQLPGGEPITFSMESNGVQAHAEKRALALVLNHVFHLTLDPENFTLEAWNAQASIAAKNLLAPAQITIFTERIPCGKSRKIPYEQSCQYFLKELFKNSENKPKIYYSIPVRDTAELMNEDLKHQLTSAHIIYDILQEITQVRIELIKKVHALENALNGAQGSDQILEIKRRLVFSKKLIESNILTESIQKFNTDRQKLVISSNEDYDTFFQERERLT